MRRRAELIAGDPEWWCNRKEWERVGQSEARRQAEKAGRTKKGSTTVVQHRGGGAVLVLSAIKQTLHTETKGTSQKKKVFWKSSLWRWEFSRISAHLKKSVCELRAKPQTEKAHFKKNPQLFGRGLGGNELQKQDKVWASPLLFSGNQSVKSFPDRAASNQKTPGRVKRLSCFSLKVETDILMQTAKLSDMKHIWTVMNNLSTTRGNIICGHSSPLKKSLRTNGPVQQELNCLNQRRRQVFSAKQSAEQKLSSER